MLSSAAEKTVLFMQSQHLPLPHSTVTLDRGAYEELQNELQTLRQQVKGYQHEAFQMRALVEFAPAAIAIFDRQMCYLAASRRWKEDYNLGECELLGRSHYEIFPEIPEGWKQVHQRCLKGAVERCEEEIFLRSDGHIDWLQWEVRPWYDAEGKVGGIVMLTEVITRRKQAEIALRQINLQLEGEVKFRTRQLHQSLQELDDIKLTLDQSAIFSITDARGNILHANDKFCQISQYSLDELIGQNHRIIKSDYHPLEFFKELWQTISSGQIWQGEICNQAKDGSLYWVETTIVPCLNDLGQPDRYLALRRDISARKQTEQENQTLAALIENSSDFIAFASLEGQMLYVNPAGREIVGLAPSEDVRNKTILDLIQPEERTHFHKEKIEPIFKNGYARGSFRFQNLVSNEIVPLDYTSFLIKDINTGKPTYLASVCRDVRRQKETEFQLQQQAEALEKTLEELKRTQAQMLHSEKMSSLGQVVAGVAHEINNPICFIQGNLEPAHEYARDLLALVELYQAYYPEPPQEICEAQQKSDLEFIKHDFLKLLESMRAGSQRIRKIVLSLRNFARLDEAEFKEVDLHEGIDSALMILQSRLKRSPGKAAIEVVRGFGALPNVKCYPGQLNQVFMNLLANAIDAIDERDQNRMEAEIEGEASRIWIQTEICRPGWVEVRIKDNGIGLSQETAKRMFDPFFSTKTIGKGTGLGLSVSYQIVVERHGGELECVPILGGGVESIVRIPIVK